MKKNLLYLFALICSVTLFTACSDDDETPVAPTAADLAGTYTGTLTLALGEGTEPTEVGTTVPIEVIAGEGNTITISLTGFNLGGELPLDIVVENCAVTFGEDNVGAIQGQKDLELALFPGMALPTTVTGTCDGTDLNLNMDVTNAPLVGTVHVTYDGTK